ncbi:MAG TPA: LuxR C-terminal-related transcriptional regulator [Gaiellaceae bacterium]|nr:LuxR C-terminal-related transcriptional regulator [Gaiellaceae bacterium]
MTELHKLGGDVRGALETINVPSYVIDPSGVIRWCNPAARRLVGDVRGKQFTSVVAPEETRRARDVFARNLIGPGQVHDSQVVVIGADGERIGVELSSVPLVEDHRVVGIFGQVSDVDETPPRPAHPHLTPRQAEVLRLLERGRSTDDIALELHLSVETVRNHIRHILRALGVHSRLEAVAVAHRQHLVTVS